MNTASPLALALTFCGAAFAAQDRTKAITEADCTAARLGTQIAPRDIGAPVSGVTLEAPRWHAAAAALPAYCRVEGAIASIDTSATPIRFGVVFPASWQRRAAQFGGGGMNGVIPRLTVGVSPGMPPLYGQGFAIYGSDSGHQAASAPPSNDWALHEEAIANLGYLQLKKTHDAAMVLIRRIYGKRPRFNYFFGGSQGGREALTAVQRYPADYDGVSANVPIVNFSSLMLAPEWIRIQEKPLANWMPPAKVNAIRGEFMRQCDSLDGLADGVINNYMACRATFDVKQGSPGRQPWATKRCPNGVDPNPHDITAAACLTEGQIATLQMIYSRYAFATPLAHGVKTFGMWLPNTDPAGSGLIATVRYRGQEGAVPGAPVHSHLGVLGVTGFLMKDLQANPLDYVEGGPLDQRRAELSAMLDSTNPDLSVFRKHGGKLVVTIGTNDTLASPGAQLDYYQSVLDKMGRSAVDSFARFFVLPQTGHGLTGNSYSVNGDGKTIPAQPIPNTFDRLALLMDWVEHRRAPGKSLTVTAGERSLPMCSYPEFPKYTAGPAGNAGSYACSPQ